VNSVDENFTGFLHNFFGIISLFLLDLLDVSHRRLQRTQNICFAFCCLKQVFNLKWQDYGFYF